MTTALLIIDMQQAILAGLVSTDRQPDIDARLGEVAARLGQIKHAAETAAIPVILIQHDGHTGHRLEKGTAGWEFRTEIAPQSDTVIVHKRSSDSFHETDLFERLEGLGVDHLVVGGCMTQFCVDTTVRRAVSSGFNVTLLEDGHATADFGPLSAAQIIDYHNELLSGFDAGANTVQVMPSEHVSFVKA